MKAEARSLWEGLNGHNPPVRMFHPWYWVIRVSEIWDFHPLMGYGIYGTPPNISRHQFLLWMDDIPHYLRSYGKPLFVGIYRRIISFQGFLWCKMDLQLPPPNAEFVPKMHRSSPFFSGAGLQFSLGLSDPQKVCGVPCVSF